MFNIIFIVLFRPLPMKSIPPLHGHVSEQSKLTNFATHKINSAHFFLHPTSPEVVN